ncbi:diguanylate cyclase [Candidatus Oscillochloris fontis]|uniref:diguanylate cyclase n=1 Tax=Candidatus Oscillochloris fontis TaxID=2496868 RepID=UPI001375C9B2|nr:diguanylate cyclase [Candidatus Oscillochloris fontis]
MTVHEQILVADDDPALCLLLRETLQDVGYEVRIASNGDELVRMAQDQPPDLLLVDLMMPLMDGFEAIRQLRNDTRTAHLPMIILTARSTSSDVVTGFDSGADDYIIKPYDIDVLLARIRSHLRRAAQLPVRNPLTGMPGNVLLQAELERQLGLGHAFSLLWIDLDNFKAFNDAYGFARGDRAIHLLAHVITEITAHDDFIGHIGGDDFAIIHFGNDPEALCKRLIARFDEKMRTLYDPADLERGYLRGIDRHGVARQFGLLSLSIAVVSTNIRSFTSVDHLSQVSAELKQAAKHISGNSYVLDRRHNVVQVPEIPQDRRGQQRPEALLIEPNEALRATIATTVRLQGYRPMVATNVVSAQGLLARHPSPALLIANSSDPGVWGLWNSLQTTTQFIALVPNKEAIEAASKRGAKAVVIIQHNLGDVTDQLLLHVPHATISEALDESEQHEVIRELEARTRILEREANEDSLTGLFNRRYVDAHIEELAATSVQLRHTLCAIMGDIDNFKQVNDQFSHMLGNDVLRTVAKLMRQQTRESDLVARYGGEEFLILLPNTLFDEAVLIAEAIRNAVESYCWYALEPRLRVTLSLGVAVLRNGNIEQMIATADQQLYVAKRTGKNRVAY